MTYNVFGGTLNLAQLLLSSLDVIRKTGSTCDISHAIRRGPSHAHGQGAEKLGEVRYNFHCTCAKGPYFYFRSKM